MTISRKLRCVFAMTAGALATVSGAFAQQVTPLFAVLNGGNQCNGASPPLCRQGDLGGFGSATVIFPTATVVCFGITVSGLSAKPILAHIHSGASGINGPIVVPFVPPFGGNPGTSSACVSAAAATIAAIRADPAKFYVNVHTTAFPAGAIRGQLQ
jgi:CHRD domain